MAMTHAAIQELLGVYALDALDEHERDIVDVHLRECPRCRAEVVSHREVAALLANTGAPAPDGVWGRIVEALEGEEEAPAMRLMMTPLAGPDTPIAPTSPEPPRSSDTSNVVALRPEPRRHHSRWLVGLASAAAALILVLGVSLVRQSDRLAVIEESLRDVSLDRVAEGARTDPTATQVALKSPDGKRAMSLALTTQGVGYFEAGGLPELASDRTYQLWALTDDHTISLGTFSGDAQVVPFQVDAEVVKAFAVTEEESGGVTASQNIPILSGNTS